MKRVSKILQYRGSAAIVLSLAKPWSSGHWITALLARNALERAFGTPLGDMLLTIQSVQDSHRVSPVSNASLGQHSTSGPHTRL